MSLLRILVIADPKAPFLAPLSKQTDGIQFTISDDLGVLKEEAPEAEVILFAHGRPELLLDVLAIAQRSAWIHSLWTGVEGILTDAIRKHSAPLTNGKGVFSVPLADWTIAAMLFFAFELRRVLQQQEQGIWKMVHGTLLEGQTLGVVGYGSIGSAAAVRARHFDMKVIASRRRSEIADDSVVRRFYAPNEIPALMAESDYILVSTPLTDQTRGLIGAAEIAAMKRSAVIINVGRGPVIDEPALIAALQSGAIRGAALDVFNVEPLPADHPFWKLENVLLSPHTADRVEGFLGPALQSFLDNLSRYLNKEELLNIVDKSAGY